MNPEALDLLAQGLPDDMYGPATLNSHVLYYAGYKNVLEDAAERVERLSKMGQQEPPLPDPIQDELMIETEQPHKL